MRFNSYQREVNKWMLTCFGGLITLDKRERNFRFLEEAIELVQANGCTKEEAYALVDYVFGRDQGNTNQEVGGVMVTLAALCNVIGVDFVEAAEEELARINRPENIKKIREKQAGKKIVGGPLP